MIITFCELSRGNKELYATIWICTKMYHYWKLQHFNRYQSNEFKLLNCNIPALGTRPLVLLDKWRQAVFTWRKALSAFFVSDSDMTCPASDGRGRKSDLETDGQSAFAPAVLREPPSIPWVTWSQCSERSLINVATMAAAEGNRQIVCSGFGQEVTLFSLFFLKRKYYRPKNRLFTETTAHRASFSRQIRPVQIAVFISLRAESHQLCIHHWGNS